MVELDHQSDVQDNSYGMDFENNLKIISDFLDNKENYSIGPIDNFSDKIWHLLDRSFLNFLEKTKNKNQQVIDFLYNKVDNLLLDYETPIGDKDRQALYELKDVLEPYTSNKKTDLDLQYKWNGPKERFNQDNKFLIQAKDKLTSLSHIPVETKKKILTFLDNPTKENIQNLQKMILQRSKWLVEFDRIDFYKKSFDSQFTWNEHDIDWSKTPDWKFWEWSMKWFFSFLDAYDYNFFKKDEAEKRALSITLEKEKEKNPELYANITPKGIKLQINEPQIEVPDISHLTSHTQSLEDDQISAEFSPKQVDIPTIVPVSTPSSKIEVPDISHLTSHTQSLEDDQN
jgi:hypothetical protein